MSKSTAPARTAGTGPSDAEELERSAGEDIAREVGTGQALGVSEERFRRAFDTALDAMLITDDDRVYVEANPAAAGLLRLDQAELVGRRADEFTPAELRGGLDEAWRAFLEKGEAQGEYQILRADGQLLDIESTAIANFTPGHHLSILRDVTSRAEGERERRNVQERLQGLIDGSASAIYVKDQDLRYELTNAAFDQLFDLRPGEMLGQLDDYIVSPEVVKEIRTHDRRVLDQAETVVAEEVVPSADGTQCIYLTQKFPLRDPHGQIVAVCGISTDITQRKQAEAELSSRADQQAAVAGLGRKALAGGNLGALREEAVTVVAKMLDVEIAKVLEFVPSEGHLRLVAAVGLESELVGEATVATGTASHAGYTLLSGETVGVDDYAQESRFSPSPLLSEHDIASGMTAPIEGASGLYGVLSVHSKNKRSFSRDAAHFLQAVGNVLAAAITRDRAERLEHDLNQAQRLETVGQLAGGVAHDFNNLLAVIINYAEFAMDAVEPESQLRGDITEIKRAAERGAELTQQLLMFSRKDLSPPDILDVSELVDGLASLLRRTIGEHISLRINLLADAPPVEASRAQLERVIVNLAVNSRDAMPDGGVLTIETKGVALTEPLPPELKRLAPGAYVRLTVSDTGLGMTREVRERAFEPFFTTKETGKGTGLGLATVYGVIASAGGHTALYSEKGMGTTVRVYLPSTVKDTQHFASTELEEPPKGSPPIGLGVHVLVVEDEDAVRELTQRILRAAGYTVQAAASGAEALSVIEREGSVIDLLITDVVMPGMSGKDLAERMATVCPETVVMFMSGYAGDVLSHHQLDIHDLTLLEKPFGSADLLSATREALRTRDSG